MDQCLFGSECPGVGSKVVDGHDHTLDHIAPTIAKFDFLTEADRKKIFEDNARRVFNLDI